jgi:hypothetical protein
MLAEFSGQEVSIGTSRINPPPGSPVGGSESSRPFPASVKYSEQFQTLAPDPVWNDVWCAGHHKFPSSSQAAGSTHLRLRLESPDGIENSTGCERRARI